MWAKRIYKSCNLLLVGFLVVGGVLFVVPQTKADATNLIPNAGFESSTAGQPDNWTPESWGSNSASFQYLATGHSGSHAAQTTVTNYSDGDAKWMFDPVSVSAGQQYTYTDWYRASAATNVWAQYTAASGDLSYGWLGGVAPSTTWSQVSEKLTVPTGVTAVSVFHVLNANGQLAIDDASLTEDVPACSPQAVNGLLNGGFEQTCPANPNVPAGWQTQTYGPDPASYGYSTDAHSGAHAVTINNTSASDEAGWTTSVSAPAANQRYNVSFWQKGTVYVYAYVVETLTDGTTQSVGLESVPSTAGIYGSMTPVWSQYSDTFVTPANVQSLAITIATSGTGNLTLDDVALTPLANQTPVNFTRGKVSVTLDDGWASQYNTALPILKQNGFTATFYVNAGTLGATGYMTGAQLQQLASGGNEIGSHLYHHSDMVQLDQATLASELSGNKTTLQQILGSNYPVTDFASPYGSYVSGDIDTVMQYEQSHRTTDNSINTKANLNPRQIHAKLIGPATTLADVNSWIAQAKSDHDWLVLVYHGVTASPVSDDEAQDAVTPAQFKQQMAAIKSSGLTVQPVNAVLADLLAQE